MKRRARLLRRALDERQRRERRAAAAHVAATIDRFRSGPYAGIRPARGTPLFDGPVYWDFTRNTWAAP